MFARGVITGACLSAVATLALVAAWWMATSRPPASAKAPTTPPAKVDKTFKEDDVHRITLTAEAIERLALRTAEVERKPMRRMRGYGGEVMVPIGQTIVVSAPISGLIRIPGDAVPQVGQQVKARQPLFELLPLLTPEGRANLAASKTDADGQVKSAQAQRDAAEIALRRAERVFQSEAGSRRAVDEAQAQLHLAEKALEAAIARRDLLSRVVGEVETGTTAPIVIESPQAGLLRSVGVLPGQNVPAGAALFEVMDLTRVWVRTPVYVGDLPTIDASAKASVGNFSAVTGTGQWPAQPAGAPPSANAANGTVDLFYELDNAKPALSPGQRVSVSLPLKEEAESLTLPWSAVVIDIHGGNWVYEAIGEREFVRRRVTVRYVSGETAVLAAGPAPKTHVVVAGAAELFGTETGFTK
jgi:membrane fusion protein, heavy metal efflux system